MGTYAEARGEYISKMGEELGTTYHLLWNECAFIHIRWDEFVELYGASQAEFDVMNGVAPDLFKTLQDSLWESVLLHLCRLTDPATTGKKRNLTLRSMLEITASSAVPKLSELVDAATASTEFARDWRNRAIAHNDFDHFADRTAKPLMAASRAGVKAALAAIVAALDAVDFHFTGSTSYFSGVRNGGGTRLIKELRLALRVREERQNRLENGLPAPDDLDYSKWH